jgi:hypothetical protein
MNRTGTLKTNNHQIMNMDLSNRAVGILSKASGYASINTNARPDLFQ